LQRAWRRHRNRKLTAKDLQRKATQLRKQEEEAWLTSPETLWACKTIIKYWKNFKKGKTQKGLITSERFGSTLNVI